MKTTIFFSLAFALSCASTVVAAPIPPSSLIARHEHDPGALDLANVAMPLYARSGGRPTKRRRVESPVAEPVFAHPYINEEQHKQITDWRDNVHHQTSSSEHEPVFAHPYMNEERHKRITDWRDNVHPAKPLLSDKKHKQIMAWHDKVYATERDNTNLNLDIPLNSPDTPPDHDNLPPHVIESLSFTHPPSSTRSEPHPMIHSGWAFLPKDQSRE